MGAEHRPRGEHRRRVGGERRPRDEPGPGGEHRCHLCLRNSLSEYEVGTESLRAPWARVRMDFVLRTVGSHRRWLRGRVKGQSVLRAGTAVSKSGSGRLQQMSKRGDTGGSGQRRQRRGNGQVSEKSEGRLTLQVANTACCRSPAPQAHCEDPVPVAYREVPGEQQVFSHAESAGSDLRGEQDGAWVRLRDLQISGGQDTQRGHQGPKQASAHPSHQAQPQGPCWPLNQLEEGCRSHAGRRRGSPCTAAGVCPWATPARR